MAPPRTVLLVDDDEDVRVMVRLGLEAAGYSVATATNGREALELVDSSIDVIVLDWWMPVMSGAEFLDAMTQLAPPIPIVVMSGSFVPPDPRIAVHLVKPVAMRDLVDVIAHR